MYDSSAPSVIDRRRLADWLTFGSYNPATFIGHHVFGTFACHLMLTIARSAGSVGELTSVTP